MYKGELIAITVALMWTACAMFAEAASRRIGALCFNVVRMTMSLPMLVAAMWWFMGTPYPVGADATTWLWLSLSGFVGYVLGDFCLINGYVLIGSRYGQLLMTLAPPTAAVFGWMLLGQRMSALAIVGMVVTLSGIGIAISRPGRREKRTERLPLRGILFGIGAAIGQGLGLVLSAKGLMHYEEQMSAAGVAQTIMALTPVLIILPTYLLFRQKVLWQEVVGSIISVCGVSLFFM